jgi:hypothetical protein
VKILLGAVLLLFFSFIASAQSPVLKVLGEELERNSRILKEKADPKPYFISYEITESEFHTLGASLGALTFKNSGRTRHLDVSCAPAARNSTIITAFAASTPSSRRVTNQHRRRSRATQTADLIETDWATARLPNG